MTYEEFEQLAMNPLRPDCKTVFVVTEIDMCCLPDRRRSYYPKFDVYRNIVGYSCSLEGAEALMHKAIESTEDVSEIYCFHIVEHFLDHQEEDEVSWRLYSNRGELIDHSWHEACLTRHSSVFRGRPKSSIRFKAGDIVEVLNGNEVRLAVATQSPIDIEWCWEYRNRCLMHLAGNIEGKDIESEWYYGLDGSDDQAAVIDGPGYECHDHISSLNIMPLRFPISKRLRERYESYWQVCLKQDEEYKKRRESEHSKV